MGRGDCGGNQTGVRGIPHCQWRIEKPLQEHTYRAVQINGATGGAGNGQMDERGVRGAKEIPSRSSSHSPLPHGNAPISLASAALRLLRASTPPHGRRTTTKKAAPSTYCKAALRSRAAGYWPVALPPLMGMPTPAAAAASGRKSRGAPPHQLPHKRQGAHKCLEAPNLYVPVTIGEKWTKSP